MSALEHYEQVREGLNYIYGVTAEMEAAYFSIMAAHEFGRQIFLRNGGPEVSVTGAASRGSYFVLALLPGCPRPCVIDPRALYAPSPLELLARQAE